MSEVGHSGGLYSLLAERSETKISWLPALFKKWIKYRRDAEETFMAVDMHSLFW
jgi:hypothetical protein